MFNSNKSQPSLATDVFSYTLQSIGVCAERNVVIAVLFCAVLFPLCKLRDLTALKNVSKMGLIGQALATLVILARSIDQSYAPGGMYFLERVASRVVSAAVWKRWFVFASLLSYCFVAHYNAPKYYIELEGTSPEKYGKMASVSYMISAALYIITMSLGISAFGPSTQPFLLNNLSPKDPLAMIARLAFGASVLASFPLIFIVMRNWFIFISITSGKLSFVGGRKRVTSILLGLIAVLTTRLRDISFVGSLSGATLGCGMAFIFPSIIYMRALWLNSIEKKTKLPRAEFFLNGVLLFAGVTLSLLGTINCLFGF